MKVRDLKPGEFNVLVVPPVSLDRFMDTYRNSSIGYASRFEILADLESQIKGLNELPEVVLCEYKPGGDCIFRLDTVFESTRDQSRMVVYNFDTIVS